MALRIRFLPLAAAALVVAAGLAACRPNDGGADATPAASTDAAAETPLASVDSDDPY